MMLLCHLDDLPQGTAKGFDPLRQGRDSVFVVRQGETLHAYRDVCPHYGDTTLPWRKDGYLDRSGEHVVCASHGARFEIATGLCISGPCKGQSLTGIHVEVTDTGQVWANL